jgi:hypothetical protein
MGRSFARLQPSKKNVAWCGFFGAEGEKLLEIYRRMLAEYGQSAVSQRKVYEWVERFKSG